MMKKSGWKKATALLMGVVIAASLAACGSQGGGSAAVGENSSETLQEESLASESTLDSQETEDTEDSRTSESAGDSQVSEGTENSQAAEGTEEQPVQADGAQEGGTDGGQVEQLSEQPAEDDAEASVENQGQPSVEAGKTLVVYFSATGHTENVAGYIAAAADADIFVLEPVEPYSSDDLDWRDENSRVAREHENEEERDVELVAATVEDWESYDTVFIGYPIWWDIAAWPVNGFIAANDFTGKTVIPFCTSSSSDLSESRQLLEEAAGTGNWLEGARFSSSDTEETVREWVESLNLRQ